MVPYMLSLNFMTIQFRHILLLYFWRFILDCVWVFMAMKI
nr:MAG TPA: hypothetical protein [Caudoviricetes sp.]